MPLHNTSRFMKRFILSQRNGSLDGLRKAARSKSLTLKQAGNLFDREILRIRDPLRSQKMDQILYQERLHSAVISAAMANTGFGTYFRGREFLRLKKLGVAVLNGDKGAYHQFVETLAGKIRSTKKENALITALSAEIIAIQKQIETYNQNEKKK